MRVIDIRKIDIEVLPRWEDTENKNKIRWKSCIGIEVPFTYDNIEGKIKILNFDSKTEKLLVQYLNNEPVEINSTNFKDGRLGSVLRLTKYPQSKKYRYNEGDIVKVKNNGRLEILEQIRKARNKKGKTIFEKAYRYKCLKCGNIDTSFANNINKGIGCGVCNGSKVLKGYNDIATLRPDLIDYFYNEESAYEYGINSHIVDWIKCPHCNAKKKMQIKLLVKRGFNCPLCDKTYSRPNKLAYSILNDLNIDFEIEKLFGWCRYPRYNKETYTKGLYDFYFKIGDKEYILEMDGGHHKIGRGEITADEQQYIDRQKDKLAEEHNMEVIRIDCFYSELKYIKNKILNSRLKEVLNLDALEWDKYKNIFN